MQPQWQQSALESQPKLCPSAFSPFVLFSWYKISLFSPELLVIILLLLPGVRLTFYHSVDDLPATQTRTSHAHIRSLSLIIHENLKRSSLTCSLCRVLQAEGRSPSARMACEVPRSCRERCRSAKSHRSRQTDSHRLRTIILCCLDRNQ